jgi:Streptomyces sporulation and cell division protein, SsgA
VTTIHPAGRETHRQKGREGILTQRIKIGLTMNTTVSAELEVQLVSPQRMIMPLVASLFYSSEDPYAIRVVFHDGDGEPVEWTFARDLLSMGLRQREGPGDFTVWPSAGFDGGAPGSVLNIELCSPFGQAHFEASARRISDFLRRTYQIIPAGEESEHIDFETGLRYLLR